MTDYFLGTDPSLSGEGGVPIPADPGPDYGNAYPWLYPTYRQWLSANDGNTANMWAQVEHLQHNPLASAEMGTTPLQSAGKSLGMSNDQLLRGLFELQQAEGKNLEGGWEFSSAANTYSPAYVAAKAYKQLGLDNADKVLESALEYQNGPWTNYVNSVLAALSPRTYDEGFGLGTLLPIAGAAIGLPGIIDFFSGLSGGGLMGAELGGIADAMNLGFGAGGIPVEASWLGAGMEGMGSLGEGAGMEGMGSLGEGAAWDSLSSLIGGDGWDYAPGALSGFGADTGAPVVDLDRLMADWGRPDMGSTFANWLDNPMAALRKLRGMSPLAKSGGPLQSGWNILSGLYGLNQSRQLADLASKASERADPFGPYRAGYAQQLAALSANPSLITKQPGYAAGLEAVRRSLAAQGYQGSGNMMAALSQYGQKFLGDEQNRLATLAGAGFNPASAGQLNLEGNISAAQLLGSSLNRLGGGLWQLLA